MLENENPTFKKSFSTTHKSAPDLQELDYKLLFEKAPGSYLVLLPDSPTFTIVGVSDAYTQQTHVKRENMLGRPVFEVFPDNPDDPHATGVKNLRRSLDRVIITHRPDTMPIQQYDIRLPDSNRFDERFWSPINSPVINSRGELTHIIHRVEDVSEFLKLKQQNSDQVERFQKELFLRSKEIESKNKELHDSHEEIRNALKARDESILNAEKTKAELHDFFMQTPIAMALLMGPEHRYTLVNPQFQATSGRDPVGLTVSEAFEPAEAHHYIPLLDGVYNTGVPYIGREVPFPRKDEQGRTNYLYLDVHYHPFRNAEGKTVGVLAYVVDVTYQVQMIKKLELSKQKLEDAVGNLKDEQKIRETFVAALSHDLRTPLTAAKMSAQLLLRRGNESGEFHKTASRIVENMERSDKMIQDLLDAHLITAGESIPVEFTKCDLFKLALKTTEELSTVHGDRFTIKIEQTITGYWGEDEIRRIIENLCSNAIKYGAVNKPITISLEQDEIFTWIKVHNFGSPISEQDQRRLFDPFIRSSSAVTGGKKGWGLGLTLVKGLVYAHGGDVSVESNSEAGTSFIVQLPNDSRSQAE